MMTSHSHSRLTIGLPILVPYNRHDDITFLLTIGFPILVPYNRVRDQQLLYKWARLLAAMMIIKSSAGVTLRGEH